MRLIPCLLIISMLLVGLPMTARAAETGNTHFWRGIWNGEEMTVAVITRGYDNSEKVRHDEPWWRWGNTTTDAYLFNWTDDEMVDLIVDFSMHDGRPRATIYAPRIGSQRAAIRVLEGEYRLVPELNPDLIVSPTTGGWIENGKLNFNLEGLESNPETGLMEWSFRVGSDEPGIPSWTTRDLIAEREFGSGDPSFGARVRMDPEVPFVMAKPLLPTWPYLSAGRREGHFGRIQPIYYSPQLRILEQNWTGFHIAGMYQINSISPPPGTDFESPFAFYQFDREAGNYANLVIRSDIWPADTRHGPSPHYVQRTAARMTWTGSDADRWRYSLSVAGNHPHQDIIQIGDRSVIAVSYEDYPDWVTAREWKAVTFVEAINGETGSEGIYEYSVEDNHQVTSWINGFLPQPPLDLPELTDEPASYTLEQLQGDPIASFRWPYLEFPYIHPLRLKEGFRGEYSLNYDRHPGIYFSPIDNRPHLLHAAEGIWNVGNGRVLRTTNLDGGPFIDQWTLERISPALGHVFKDVVLTSPGTMEESLYSMSNLVVHSNESEQVRLLLMDEAPRNEILPVPTDDESWREFLDTSEDSSLENRDPLSLESWMNEMDGDEVRIERATVEHIHATDDGIGFTLTLKPGFLVQGPDILGIADQSPGTYSVTYDGTFTVELEVAAVISISFTEMTAVELQSVPIGFTLRNESTLDITGATLVLTAVSESGETLSVHSLSVDLLAASELSEVIHWVPPGEGEWTIVATIESQSRPSMHLDDMNIMVAHLQEPKLDDLLRVTASSMSRFGTLLGLSLFTIIASVIWWKAWRPVDTGGRVR